MKFSVHSFSTPDRSLVAEYVRTVDGHRAVNLYGSFETVAAFARAFHPVVEGALYAVTPRLNRTGSELPVYAAVEGPRRQTFGKFLRACITLGMQKSVTLR